MLRAHTIENIVSHVKRHFTTLGSCEALKFSAPEPEGKFKIEADRVLDKIKQDFGIRQRRIKADEFRNQLVDWQYMAKDTYNHP